ncbi:MAG: hypothetical protein ABI388_08840 [Bacteroidia bacterium]
MKKLISFLFLLIVGNTAFAQNFTQQVIIDSVQTDGMHRIELTPKIREYAKLDLSDVRILDEKQNQIPYIVLNESAVKRSTSFIEYKIVSTEIKSNRFTKITIENTDKQPINNVSLCIANADILKTCRISGSDDMKQWYAVSDVQELAYLYDNDNTKSYKTIYFPQVDYRYYQIFINDSNSAPLNISKAGYFKGFSIDGTMLDVIPQKTNTTNDSKNKKTLIAISFTNMQVINQMVFKITGPKFYKRQASIFVKRQRAFKKKIENYTEVLYEFELNSSAPQTFDLRNINEKEFVIEIANLDNPSLKIEQLTFKQLGISLVADLKTTEKYKLVMGDKNLQAPQYDLDYFKDKIPKQLPVVHLGIIEPIKTTSKIANTETASFWQQKWFMWLCISLGALIIFLFSFKLLKEIQNNE